MEGNITSYLAMSNLNQYVNKNILLLLSGCLRYEENERNNIEQIINQPWLSTYYQVYAQRVLMKSSRQQRRKKIITFPHYVSLKDLNAF